jgi:hypothetical protein
MRSVCSQRFARSLRADQSRVSWLLLSSSAALAGGALPCAARSRLSARAIQACHVARGYHTEAHTRIHMQKRTPELDWPLWCVSLVVAL